MAELFIMEYLTVLYMIMAFLFMDSQYSRRHTLFIVSKVTILLMAAVAALYRAVDVDAALRARPGGAVHLCVLPKNGAVCQFNQTDGWFRLRLVL